MDIDVNIDIDDIVIIIYIYIKKSHPSRISEIVTSIKVW